MAKTRRRTRGRRRYVCYPVKRKAKRRGKKRARKTVAAATGHMGTGRSYLEDHDLIGGTAYGLNPGRKKRRRRRSRRTQVVLFSGKKYRGRRPKLRGKPMGGFSKRGRRLKWFARRGPKRRKRGYKGAVIRRTKRGARVYLFNNPGPLGFNLHSIQNYAVDGATIGVGLGVALFLPKQLASSLGKPSLNQGWTGVGVSAASTAVVVGVVGKFASRRLAGFLGLGGALATVIRAISQLAPAQVNQYVLNPMQSDVVMSAMKSAPKALPAPGVSDWVSSGGMADWVNMSGAMAKKGTVGGDESF